MSATSEVGISAFNALWAGPERWLSVATLKEVGLLVAACFFTATAAAPANDHTREIYETELFGGWRPYSSGPFASEPPPGWRAGPPSPPPPVQRARRRRAPAPAGGGEFPRAPLEVMAGRTVVRARRSRPARRRAYARIRSAVGRTGAAVEEGHERRALYHFVFAALEDDDEAPGVLPEPLFRDVIKCLEG